MAAAGAPLRYGGFLVIDIAEHDRLGRTGLLTGGHDLVALQIAAFLVGLDQRGLDPLGAIGALLHDAARADRDVGIFGSLLGIAELAVVVPVEPPDLVGAVARTRA